jgi:hypothetical protein
MKLRINNAQLTMNDEASAKFLKYIFKILKKELLINYELSIVNLIIYSE